ncbi:hypothetical protein FB451DRAFT_1558242 [Mycena latifolia]|nr:hypothetical protein FB451DRAFT_1558242 [Mycena latifolia]
MVHAPVNMTVSMTCDSIRGRRGLAAMKAGAAGSKTYSLRSTLNERIIAQATLTHEAILEAEAADAPADQLGPIGILYVILALIPVTPAAARDGNIAFSATSMHRALTLDAYLTALIRQGFLDPTLRDN